jgi:hypothetical protein
MRLAGRLLGTIVFMVLVLLFVGVLGGIGTVELTIWLVLLVAALVAVGVRTRRPASS